MLHYAVMIQQNKIDIFCKEMSLENTHIYCLMRKDVNDVVIFTDWLGPGFFQFLLLLQQDHTAL